MNNGELDINHLICPTLMADGQIKREGLKRYMTTAETAQYLRVSKWSLYSLISRRKIPHARLGRLVRFDVKEIDKWMAKHTVQTLDIMKDSE